MQCGKRCIVLGWNREKRRKGIVFFKRTVASIQFTSLYDIYYIIYYIHNLARNAANVVQAKRKVVLTKYVETCAGVRDKDS